MSRKNLELFLQFLVFGVALGMTEDFIALMLLGGHSFITLKAVYIVLLVAVPFAIVTELVADRIDFSKLLGIKKRTEVFLEFLVSGIVLGVAEDLIAVSWVTGKPIGLKILLVIIVLAVTFSAISELIVDRIRILPKGDE